MASRTPGLLPDFFVDFVDFVDLADFADFGVEGVALAKGSSGVPLLASVWGGKAASLRRLCSVGLATPPGFVVTHALFAALTASGRQSATLDDAAVADLAAAVAASPFPEGFEDALQARLRGLVTKKGYGAEAARFSVRSSFAQEDKPGAVAAGIYDSVVGVTAEAVPAALRRVLRSALGIGAVAYARARGKSAIAPPLAVLVHPFIAGPAHGSAACEGAGTDSVDLRVQPAGVIVDLHAGTLSPEGRSQVEAAARDVAARFGPSELEWVQPEHGDVVFLQLRPYTPPSPARAWHGFAALAADESPAQWTWDAAHNPLPLSAAHAGLIAWVDQRCRIGIRQRVLGGYLFWAPAGHGETGEEQVAADGVSTMLAEITARAERDLAALATPPPLTAALDVFTRHYQPLLGELAPALRAARDQLATFLAAHFPHLESPTTTLATLLSHVESKKSERGRQVEAIARAVGGDRDRALAAYLAMFGDEAAAWDLAAPTARERPDLVLASLAGDKGLVSEISLPGSAALDSGPASAARLKPVTSREGDAGALAAHLADQLPEALRADWDQVVTQARSAVAAGEDDDWLYARLQAPIRYAIRALTARLNQSRPNRDGWLTDEESFDLSLSTLLALERGESLSPQRIAAEVSGNRAVRLNALAAPPSLGAGRDTFAGPAMLRGAGTGGRAIGRVVFRHGPRGQAPPSDAVLVAVSLLPTELPLLSAAALIIETGGPLGHVATLARERGLPAVVGVAGATTLLGEGDLVVVDADTGIVVRTEGGPRGRPLP